MDVRSWPAELENDALWTARRPRQKTSSSKRRMTNAEKEEDKLLRREKNRIAAQASRARKLKSLLNLQHDMESLQKANASMQEQLSQIQAKAVVAYQSHMTLKEEIQHVLLSRTPAEQQDLSRLLECIFTLSATQKVVSSLDAPALDLRYQVGRTAAKTASSAEKQQNAQPEKRQSALRKCKSESGQAKSVLSNVALPASPHQGTEVDEEEEIFRLDSPIPVCFLNKQMPLETPMHWLFY